MRRQKIYNIEGMKIKLKTDLQLNFGKNASFFRRKERV